MIKHIIIMYMLIMFINQLLLLGVNIISSSLGILASWHRLRGDLVPEAAAKMLLRLL